MSDSVTIHVAPTFATNLRAKLYSALQPRRLALFLFAIVIFVYYAFRGPDERFRHACLVLAIVVPLLRVFVIVLSSMVTKRSRERFTMTLSFSEDAIDVTHGGITTRDDWSFVRTASHWQRSIVLRLRRSYRHVLVLVDRSKVSADDWTRFEGMLELHRKL